MGIPDVPRTQQLVFQMLNMQGEARQTALGFRAATQTSMKLTLNAAFSPFLKVLSPITLEAMRKWPRGAELCWVDLQRGQSAARSAAPRPSCLPSPTGAKFHWHRSDLAGTDSRN